MRVKSVTVAVLVYLICFFISACGGGGDDDSGAPGTSSSVLSGVFVDAIVSGLDYSTPTQSNVTDAIGQFNYMSGETVTFSIGGILLGSATGGSVLTPLDLVPSATGTNDPRVLNIVRLLLSLDDDGNPDNGITISPTFQTAADSVSSEVQSLTTDIELQNLLDIITGSAVTLVDNVTAEAHLRDTMVELGIPIPEIFAVGGNVTGSTGTVVLQNNGGDNLSVSGNIGFIFTNGLADQDSYNVTVLTNPNGQTCVVINGSGSISGTNVTDVTVTCTIIDQVAPSIVTTFDDPIIDVSTTFTLMFDETMQPQSLAFSGDLGDEASASWSQGVVADDTLEISAKVEWPIGTGQSLIIDANDLAGNSLATLTLVFDVSVIHVSIDATNANDSNVGTRDQPLKTIIAAVNLANSTLSKSEIRVAIGTYTTFSEGGTNIEVSDGMRLMGSYSANWLLRNPITYPSIVNDTSTTGGDFNNPNCVITISAGAGSETRVDGFTLTGGGFADDESDGGTSCGIEIEMNASPTIENNIISGGSAIDSHGILDRGLSPVIRNNTIRGSEPDAFYWFSSNGILSTGSSPIIVGNDIYAGNKWFGKGISLNDVNAIVEQNSVSGAAVENSTGVYINGTSTVLLRNNTIHGGSSYATYGVQIDAGSVVTLQNNTIFSGDGEGEFSTALVIGSPAIIENNILFGTTCIEESNIDADPIRLFANNFYSCGQFPGGFILSTFYHDRDAGCTGNADGDNDASTCTLAEMNQLTDMQVDGSNINVDLGLGTQTDADWHLNAASPASVKFGGLDLSVDFSTDKDGTQRTVPWSIGAYEQD